MVRQQRRCPPRTQARQTRRRRRNRRSFGTATRLGATPIGLIKSAVTLISSLPVAGSSISSIFDFGYNLIKIALRAKNYYTGAFATFAITPGSLLASSPLLAKDTTGAYSFPGYPISLKRISFMIRNTTQLSMHSGRWGAAFLPYRELHDATHYKNNIKNLTFKELATMPHSRVASGLQNITISFPVRDRTAYYARPRELNEEVGLVFII